MGYTHYVSFQGKRGQAHQIETKYRNAIRKCAKVIRHFSESCGGLSGYTAHDKALRYGGLNVNGSKNSGMCEPFTMREHFSQNESFFCKTNRYQYDTAVTASLIILKHYLGDAIHVSSDGLASDWVAGLELAQAVLGLKSLRIPKSIKVTRNEAA